MRDERAGRAFLLRPEAMADENLRQSSGSPPDHPIGKAGEKKEKQEGKQAGKA